MGGLLILFNIHTVIIGTMLNFNGVITDTVCVNRPSGYIHTLRQKSPYSCSFKWVEYNSVLLSTRNIKTIKSAAC